MLQAFGIKISTSISRLLKIKVRVVPAMLIGGLFIGAIFTTSHVLASIPDTGGSIHSCYTTGALGKVRIIDNATTTCNSLETPITWNQTGPAGGLSSHMNQISLAHDDATLTNPVELLAIPGFATLSVGCGLTDYPSFLTNNTAYNLEVNGGVNSGDPLDWSSEPYAPVATLAPGETVKIGSSNRMLAGVLGYKVGSEFKTAQYTLAFRASGAVQQCTFTAQATY